MLDTSEDLSVMKDDTWFFSGYQSKILKST